VNGNTVRNFPTHGQLSAAQGSLTSCLNFDFAILNLFDSYYLIDGPEVEHGAHFLILYYPQLEVPLRLGTSPAVGPTDSFLSISRRSGRCTTPS
jgi:hypothetical protein